MNIKNLLASLVAMMIIITGCKNSSNEKNYIIPGIGDAGDLAYGNKL